MFLSNVLTVHLSEALVQLNCTACSYIYWTEGKRGRVGREEKGKERGKRPGGEEGRAKVARD